MSRPGPQFFAARRLAFGFTAVLTLTTACHKIFPGQLINQRSIIATGAPIPRLDNAQDPSNPSGLAAKERQRALVERIFAADNACRGQESFAGKPMLRLLTRDEYQNTIAGLFNLSADYRNQIPHEQRVYGFLNNAEVALVSAEHAAGFAQAARDIAREVVGSKWSELASCPLSAGEACINQFLSGFGTKIYRRPLSEADKEALLKVYRAGSALSPSEGAQHVLRAMLTAPSFLYRREQGTAEALDPYELATALAYFFWAAPPDEQLLRMAREGALVQPATLLAEAQRLVQDPRARDGLKAFAENWLGYRSVLHVNKDPKIFPRFTRELRLALARETEDFFDFAFRKGQLDFTQLMAADYSIGDANLAGYYGTTATIEGDTSKVSFTAQNRRGVLGHGSLMAALASSTETNPVRRGAFVREHLLCEILVPPPPNLKVVPPPPKEGATTRERFAEHSANPVCQACHIKIDGTGFGMENLDAIGLVRGTESGKAVDARGTAVGIDGKDLPFNGAGELAQHLAQSTRAQKCFVVMSFRMLHGRMEREQDLCAIRQIAEDFVTKDQSLSQLFVTLVTHPSYTRRKD